LLGDQLSNEEFQMKAYLIVKLTVHDEGMFTEYRKQVGDTAKLFGGQFLAAGGKAIVLEGQWEHPSTVVVEFPSRESAERWYESAAYQKIIGLRLKSTRGSLVILDGV
jgi:uncharacterized protein (DUF1330 family)